MMHKQNRSDAEELDADTVRNAVNEDERSICIMLKALQKKTISLCRKTAYEYGIRLSNDETDDIVQIATINLANRHLPNFRITDK